MTQLALSTGRKPTVLYVTNVGDSRAELKLRNERGAEFIEGDILVLSKGLHLKCYIVWPLAVQDCIVVPISITKKHEDAVQTFADALGLKFVNIQFSRGDKGMQRLFCWKQPENWSYLEISTLRGRIGWVTAYFDGSPNNTETLHISVEPMAFEDHKLGSRMGALLLRRFERSIGRTCEVLFGYECPSDIQWLFNKYNARIDRDGCRYVRIEIVGEPEMTFQSRPHWKFCVMEVSQCDVEDILDDLGANIDMPFFISSALGRYFKFEIDDNDVAKVSQAKRPCSAGKRKWAHKTIVDYSIAFRNALPPYVLLEIFDWLPDVCDAEHRAKIDAIYKAKQSIEKILENKIV